jgi:hypothetical protein
MTNIIIKILLVIPIGLFITSSISSAATYAVRSTSIVPLMVMEHRGHVHLLLVEQEQ